MPKNCNECKHTNNCNSSYGGLGCRYTIRPLILTLILVFTFGSVASAMTKNEEVKEPEVIEVINAEDIGIKTVSHVYDTMPIVEETEADEDVVVETKDKTVNVSVHKAKEVVKEEPVVKDTEVPEGLYEGRKEGVYFHINTYDCEIHDGCYMCEEHTLSEEIGYDEEINPDGGWYRAIFCEVCGHGGCEPIHE